MPTPLERVERERQVRDAFLMRLYERADANTDIRINLVDVKKDLDLDEDELDAALQYAMVQRYVFPHYSWRRGVGFRVSITPGGIEMAENVVREVSRGDRRALPAAPRATTSHTLPPFPAPPKTKGLVLGAAWTADGALPGSVVDEHALILEEPYCILSPEALAEGVLIEDSLVNDASLTHRMLTVFRKTAGRRAPGGVLFTRGPKEARAAAATLKQMGREDDTVVIDKWSEWGFNPIDAPAIDLRGAAIARRLVSVLPAEEASQQYYRSYLTEYLGHAVTLLRANAWLEAQEVRDVHEEAPAEQELDPRPPGVTLADLRYLAGSLRARADLVASMEQVVADRPTMERLTPQTRLALTLAIEFFREIDSEDADVTFRHVPDNELRFLVAALFAEALGIVRPDTLTPLLEAAVDGGQIVVLGLPEDGSVDGAPARVAELIAYRLADIIGASQDSSSIIVGDQPGLSSAYKASKAWTLVRERAKGRIPVLSYLGLVPAASPSSSNIGVVIRHSRDRSASEPLFVDVSRLDGTVTVVLDA